MNPVNTPEPRPVLDPEIVPHLVSVFIPTFDRAELVIQAMRSALAQMHPLKQTIAVDDGSTDDTAERMSALSEINRWDFDQKCRINLQAEFQSRVYHLTCLTLSG